MSLGLYIHVPFCKTRCSFCAFYLQIHREDRVRSYLDSLSREIMLHAELNSLGGRPLDTVYFGGGTPTTLRPDQLCQILELIRPSFGLQDHAEITLEAHPDTVTAEGLKSLVQAGFNRISFGVQSLDDGELVKIGRRPHRNAVRAAVETARSAGFVNINLDLIYGLQGQTMASWLTTLEETIRLEPTHVSCYALTVEEGTKLHLDLRRGDRDKPDADLQNAMEDQAVRRLAASGFERYEISNYSQPGYACRHNQLYWQGEEYLGLGPSAQSYLNGCRFGNVEDLNAYHRALESWNLPIQERELLTPEQCRREAIVFGLRLIEGVDLGFTRETTDRTWEQTLDRLMDEGLLEERSGRVRMTERGCRFADTIAVELL
ncbi:MAG TPA: radical SAM family heme chaperone HemW [Nitrospiraceae bacterium]|nr:radical SAM family heme chaperone HemW [Nitrospiraceae bacterium]